MQYPGDLVSLGRSVISQSVFLSNIYFLRRDSYFADPAETLPLLHTWSLSIEEQFYIILPIILLILVKGIRSKTKHVILLIGVISFANSIYLTNLEPGNTFDFFNKSIWSGADNITAAFFFLLPRAWELILGSLIALYGISIKNKIASDVASTLGILLIITSIFFLSRDAIFPGVSALLPTFGAAAVIIGQTTKGSIANFILTNKLITFIGLISYSLYLWHWPIFVYSNFLVDELFHYQYLSLILLSISLAWISYKIIEKPFQDHHIKKPSIIIPIGAISMILVASMGYFVKFIETNENSSKYIIDNNANSPSEIFFYNDNYGHIGTSDHPTFIVWGDSVAEQILHVIDDQAKTKNNAGIFIGTRGCIPLTNVSRTPSREHCKLAQNSFERQILNEQVDTVILMGAWNKYINLYHNNLGLLVTDKKAVSLNESAAHESFNRQIINLSQQLNNLGKKLYIVRQVPYKKIDRRELFYQSNVSSEETYITPLPLKEHNDLRSETSAIFYELEKYNVEILDPTELLCDDIQCYFEDETGLLYIDGEHLTTYGAYKLKPLFERVF